MRISLVTRGSAALLLLCMSVVAVSAQSKAPSDPKSLVTAIYRYHFSHKQRWDLTFKRYRTSFGKELLALFDANDKLQAATPDEVVGLDFDPITDSQEESTGYTVTGSAADGQNTVVTVQVRVGSEHRSVRFQCARENGKWRITNVLYDEGDLAAILKTPG